MSKHVLNTRLCRCLVHSEGLVPVRQQAELPDSRPAALVNADGGLCSGDSGEEAASDASSGGVRADAARLDTLYREQSPRLLRSLTRRTADADEAYDLVQEIFCRMAGLGTGKLRLIERPQAYLSRMAVNLLRDRAKRNARRRLGDHIPAEEGFVAGADEQRRLEARDMLRRVEAAVLRLRPKTREIFMAHRVEGLSYAEIAQRTGLSVKGVEKQMSKAIAAIDRMLDRERT